MTALAIVAPVTQYFDLAGHPLDDGKLYFGVVGQNPETNPITVYWDAAGTQPAAQPVRTLNGYPVRNGKIAALYSSTDYSMTIRDKRGRLVFSIENSANFGGAQTVLTMLTAFIASLLSSIGSTLIGFLQQGTGAILRTVQDKLREHVSVLDFGADPTGSTGSGLAFQRALATGKNVYVPPGIYLIDLPLTMNSAQTLYGPGRTGAEMRLAFNGDMIKMAGYSKVTGLWLNGNGASFTGRGTYWTGTVPQGLVVDCKITGFVNECVHFVEDGTGSQTTVRDCEIYRFDQTKPGIKLPNPENYGPARRFFNIQCSGGVLADVGASDNSMFTDCQANGIIFPVPTGGVTTWAKKTLLNNCRFSTVGGTITVYGEDHNIIGGSVAGDLVLGTGTKNSKVVGVTVAGGYQIKDLSGSLYNGPANFIDYYAALTPFTATWGSSGSAPNIGNGSIAAFYTQDANRRTVNITLIAGSSTSFGTGVWQFDIGAALASSPNSSATNVGCGRIQCAGSFYNCTVLNTAGTSILTMYTNAAANGVGPAIPAAWVANSSNTLILQIDLPTA